MGRKAPLLRTQLLRWLLPSLSLLIVSDTFISYWVATGFARRAYDVALTEIAREVSLHVTRGARGVIQFDMPEPARRVLFTHPGDRLYYEVASADGRTVAGQPLPRALDAAPSSRPEKLYDADVEARRVRVVELPLGADSAGAGAWAYVRVAETNNRRNALAQEILLSVVVPQVVLILIACVLVWTGVVRGLSPLRSLQQAIASRSHLDRSPVTIEEAPGEVMPLIAEINGLLERLDAVLTLQNRFIADAAHQLKTPVAGLQAQLELALRESDAASMRTRLTKVNEGLERLARLVSQLLALARNEPDAVRHLTLTPLDLKALAFESASAWVADALKKGIDLGFDAADDRVLVLGDAVRLRELLDNLIDNAIRYSRNAGRVTVKVASTPTPTLAVADDGPRIPAQERRRIFERFHRRLGTGVADGSGLGLAIAQEIAQLHGGTITLNADAEGTGNTFSVSLPPLPAS